MYTKDSKVHFLSDVEMHCPNCGTRLREDEEVEGGDLGELLICKECDVWWYMSRQGRTSKEVMLCYRPMLAVGFDTEKHSALLSDNEHYVKELKLNGDRIIAVVWQKGTQFFTRTISKVDDLPVEKTDWLPHLNELTEEEAVILDGEIVVAKNSDHTKVGSVFNCDVNKSLERQRQTPLLWVVWDCLMFYGEDIRNSALKYRMECRDTVVAELQKQLAPVRTMEEGATLKLNRLALPLQLVPSSTNPTYHKSVIGSGGEGIIVKRLDAPYSSGDRPAGVWMKIKEQIEVDLFITGYKDAKAESKKRDGTVSVTKYKGQVGSIELSAWSTGKGTGDTIPICFSSGIDDAVRLAVSKDRKKYMGTVCRVLAQKVTVDKYGGISLQNPRIIGMRTDKRPRDCTYLDLVEAVKG